MVMRKHEYAQHLGTSLRLLFPDHQIHKNARKTYQLVSPVSGKYLELDFWIPALKLGFEYQDPHHFVEWWFDAVSKKAMKEKDENKQLAVSARGDTLIAIPFWWDSTLESLISTIKKHRPELLPSHQVSAPAIDTDPPAGLFKKGEEIPGVGGLMLSVFFRDTFLAPMHWWLSEKYDGTRICWTPKKSQLLSRNGIPVPISYANLVTHFPKVILDVEFWFGRGTFEITQKLYSRIKQPGSENNETNNQTNDDTHASKDISLISPQTSSNISEIPWENLRVVVLDFPAKENHHLKIEERFQLCTAIDNHHPFITLTSNAICENKAHLKRAMDLIVAAGGEGAVLKEIKSQYQCGRSMAFMKVKMERDQEALVIGVDQNINKYTLQTIDGQTIDLEQPAHQVVNPTPKIGDVVSFSFFRHSATAPVDPRILRVRTDVAWRDVPNSANSNNMRKDTQSAIYTRDHRRIVDSTRNVRPHGYWTIDEGKNVREFLDNYARKNRLDPLVAETWYKLSFKDLQEEGVLGMARVYSSLYRMLSTVYPEVQFDNSKFNVKYKGYWDHTSNHKRFFDNIAKEHNFDPLIAHNWYPFNSKFFLARKGSRLLRAYNTSHITALMKVYPNIGLQQHLFTAMPKRFWNSKENTKAFFDDFARKENFNPLDPENWYKITVQTILRKGGAGAVMRYNNSLSAALLDVYPTIGWDRQRLPIR